MLRTKDGNGRLEDKDRAETRIATITRDKLRLRVHRLGSAVGRLQLAVSTLHGRLGTESALVRGRRRRLTCLRGGLFNASDRGHAFITRKRLNVFSRIRMRTTGSTRPRTSDRRRATPIKGSYGPEAQGKRLLGNVPIGRGLVRLPRTRHLYDRYNTRVGITKGGFVQSRVRFAPTGLAIAQVCTRACCYPRYGGRTNGHVSSATGRLIATGTKSTLVPRDVTARSVITRTVCRGCTGNIPLCQRRGS